MGSLPCRFKKAEYAIMNFCACNTRIIELAITLESVERTVCYEVMGCLSVFGCSSTCPKTLVFGVWRWEEKTHVNISNTDTPRHVCGD